ncbi:hypothetical protein O3M35_012593 [Rhynocoris fuscipes]|uniref:Uncharacterized protein n=1 Tax=Rhynocoris fuscipes TaxID=488301 RepID=A0AAW1D0V8_9HEMI
MAARPSVTNTFWVERWNCGQSCGSTKAQFISLKSEDLFPESPGIKRNLQHQPVRFIKFKIRRFITWES